MPVDFGFAFLAGVLTIAAPCILPMLPILLGASIGQRSPLRPVLIVLGFVLSFSLVSLVFSAVTSLVGLSAFDLRLIAAAAIALMGAALLWPAPFSAVMTGLTRLLPEQNAAGGQGGLGALALGASLGLIWAPCAGPVLASILIFVATSPDWGSKLLLLLAYSIGAGVPMLIIAYGGQFVSGRVRSLARHTAMLQRVCGVLVLCTAALIASGYDTLLIARISELYPEGRVGL
ncbi:Cytochrome C biogenesis protein transmembrane region [Paracoccus halophilus]|uniref:Cytochrome C biogenesis protein transmembrane region n=1 Tax=Paracoccus halophilus TaxID=376733 RepID=A0A099EZA3_9RHOB|nr:cytochrome c biogenesis protein CcdA [Paracoccus halophilus]KGJ03785.1 hypothetical protein IT41_12660 [Paracoccus halophilus]SFA56855.1 Cytochrome C biogenesis protein transmembrane region [Paracoccus halophilus]